MLSCLLSQRIFRRPTGNLLRRRYLNPAIKFIKKCIIDRYLAHYQFFFTLKLSIRTTMIGTSPAEYFFIRICILFLHNIAPISALYCIQLLLTQVFPLPTYVEIIPYLIQIWLTAEAIFFTPGYAQKRDQQNEGEVETYVTEIEKLIGRELPPGRMDVKNIGQLLNEAGGSHRSLLWYTVWNPLSMCVEAHQAEICIDFSASLWLTQ